MKRMNVRMSVILFSGMLLLLASCSKNEEQLVPVASKNSPSTTAQRLDLTAPLPNTSQNYNVLITVKSDIYDSKENMTKYDQDYYSFFQVFDKDGKNVLDPPWDYYMISSDKASGYILRKGQFGIAQQGNFCEAGGSNINLKAGDHCTIKYWKSTIDHNPYSERLPINTDGPSRVLKPSQVLQVKLTSGLQACATAKAVFNIDNETWDISNNTQDPSHIILTPLNVNNQ